MIKAPLILATCVALSAQLSASRECYGVICVRPIERDCGRQPADICTTLVLYNSTGHRFQLQGTGNIDLNQGGRIGLKNVIRAEQVGTGGCYTLFKKKNQQNMKHQINDIGTIHTLDEPQIIRFAIIESFKDL